MVDVLNKNYWQDPRRQRLLKKLLAVGFFAYGVFYVFALDRNFIHTKYLELCLAVIIPLFVLLAVLPKFESRFAQWPRLISLIKWCGRWSTQSVAQYVLMFCLPFFAAGDHYIQLAITALLLLSTLWDDWFDKLIEIESYAKLLRLWCLLSGLSFLWPFIAPKQLTEFYHALNLVGVLALWPSSFSIKKIVQASLPILVLGVNSWLLPPDLRFPILSIWVEKPYFAIKNRTTQELIPLGQELSQFGLSEFLKSGHSLCCISPIVAPPSVREKITLEWRVNGAIVEKPELKKTVVGNSQQRAFRTSFCKRNFPPITEDTEINCMATISDTLYLGDISLDILK